MIATGSRPNTEVKNIEGLKHALTSDDIFSLPHKPKKSMVIGGGFVGSELASFLHGLGSDVTVVSNGPSLKCKRWLTQFWTQK